MQIYNWQETLGNSDSHKKIIMCYLLLIFLADKCLSLPYIYERKKRSFSIVIVSVFVIAGCTKKIIAGCKWNFVLIRSLWIWFYYLLLFLALIMKTICCSWPCQCLPRSVSDVKLGKMRVYTCFPPVVLIRCIVECGTW